MRRQEFRWTLAEQFHVTLAFMPDVPDHLVDEYGDRLADGLARTPVPVLRLAGPVAFPNAAETRALAVGVMPESEGADVVLERMAGRARNAAVTVGTEVDGQRFRPHLTIARLRRRGRHDQLGAAAGDLHRPGVAGHRGRR